MVVAYKTVDIGTDVSNPLQQGIIRYTPSSVSSTTPVRNQIPSRTDRPYVYVPAGYLQRAKGNYMEKILDALKLTLPQLIVLSPESEGSTEVVESPSGGSLSDLEVIKAKVTQLLGSVLESTVEVNAWLLPDNPRRNNAAAGIICDLLPKNTLGNTAEKEKASVALGLYGLCEDSDDKGLKTAILSTMKPMNTSVTSTINLVYDLTLQDSAPLPQITHMLIFESPEDKETFRTELLELIPSFMIAFGKISDKGKRSVFKATKDAKPVVLMQHTGSSIVKLSDMYQHVIDFFKTNPSNPNKIPPMEDADDMISLFLETWPAHFDEATVVLCDPLTWTGDELQRGLLNALSSSFSLKTGGLGSSTIRNKALDYAFSFQNIALKHCTKKKGTTEFTESAYTFSTILSIAASVVYNKIYGDRVHSSPSSWEQLTFYLSTIILPLFITTIKHEVDQGTSLRSWSAFRLAESQIESEIFKFRTQCGQYQVKKQTELALQEPVQAFTSNIKNIWTTLTPYLKADQVRLSEGFWDDSTFDNFSPSNSSTQPSTQRQGLTTPLLPMNDEEAQTKPNHYSPMQADLYINTRMKNMVMSKTNQVGQMASRNKCIQLFVKIFTLISGATAALNLQWLVPIILGIVAFLGSIGLFQQYNVRIAKGNNMIVQLNELKLWWMGLTLYEKQLPQHKEHLILTSEKIIMDEIETSFAKLVSAVNDQAES